METLRRLVDETSQTAAAGLLGLSQGMVSKLLLGQKRISAERAIEIERRMARTKWKIKRAELRPDLYGRAA